MGAVASLFGSSEILKNILIVGRSGAGKTHTLYQMMGEQTTLSTIPTPLFNNEVISFRSHGRTYEFWDPSGSEEYIPFWESLYKNIAFDVVVYVIDAHRYWNKDERQNHVVKDRMEIHQLLCCPELSHCRFIVYINWKTDLELGEERNMLEVIPQELELFLYPQRAITTVDSYVTLEKALLSMKIHEEADDFDVTNAFA